VAASSTMILSPDHRTPRTLIPCRPAEGTITFSSDASS
jgi:hypothetical protein